jgi:hypothetical protein
MTPDKSIIVVFPCPWFARLRRLKRFINIIVLEARGLGGVDLVSGQGADLVVPDAVGPVVAVYADDRRADHREGAGVSFGSGSPATASLAAIQIAGRAGPVDKSRSGFRLVDEGSQEEARWQVPGDGVERMGIGTSEELEPQPEPEENDRYRGKSCRYQPGDVFHYLKKPGLVVQQQHKGVGWIHECLAATGA